MSRNCRRSFKPIEFTCFGARLDDTIRHQRQLGIPGKSKCAFGIGALGIKTQRQAIVERHLFAVDERRKMTSVRGREGPITIDVKNQARCKSTGASGEHTGVHSRHDLTGTLGVVCQSPDGSNQEGHSHGSGQALTTHVSNSYEQTGWLGMI